ncbi:MAG: DNA adenine methylase, partial [Lachnospiraceae bacterium]|nr:DNA adenine methylase [Lachnospiraceae bacterium]
MENQLENVDIKVKNAFEELPEDFWDFKNEDTRELTHSIHNYPAVMVYPISRNILSRMMKLQNIETIMDPFMGSGTVLLEGLLAGCKTIYGNDLNPLAHNISKAKTTVLLLDVRKIANKLEEKINESYKTYAEILDDVTKYVKEKGYDITAKLQDKENWGANAYSILNDYLEQKGVSLRVKDIKGLGFWFVPKCILELQIIQNAINEITDKDVRDYFMVAFSEVTRLVSNRRNGEFKMYRMQPEKVLKYNPDVRKIFFDTLRENVDKMESLKTRVSGKELGKVML